MNPMQEWLTVACIHTTDLRDRGFTVAAASFQRLSQERYKVARDWVAMLEAQQNDNN